MKDSTSPKAQGAFPQTHWSLVLNARAENASTSGAALEKLCHGYWQPLYAYVRRFGYSQHDAQDLTQEFFARLLAGAYLGSADRGKGRFRTFLLTALKRFMINEWERARAQKRGGGMQALPLNTEIAEQAHATGPAATPDKIYDYECALALLNATLEELRKEYSAAGKDRDFEVLKPYLAVGRGEIPYEALASQLGRDPGAARVTVHRFRKRYRALFREQVGRTVARDDEIEDEVRYLIAALG